MELKKLDMDDIKRRILYGLIILSLLPLITMFYINLKQDKWETDRNFYGKEISEDQLKITQNTYQKYGLHPPRAGEGFRALGGSAPKKI